MTTSTHADTCPARPLGPLGGIRHGTTTTTTTANPSSDVKDQDQDVATIGAAAANHDRIRDMTNQPGMNHRRVADNAPRGRVLDAQLADHTATHTDPSDVHPARTASARPASAFDLPRGRSPIGVPPTPPKA